jgi:pimeloyl-ACP methyl ester carboxylesterase
MIQYDSELSDFAYPFPVHAFEAKFQRQTLKMAYMDVSPQTPTHKVAVLLHGKNFGGFYWEPTIRALTEVGFRVIVPDQIGFGKSSKPQCYQFSFQGLASNTFALLESLNIDRAAVVGHSMGGMLAVRFALMNPKFTTELVLVNPLGLEDWKTKVPYRTIDDFYSDEMKATAEGVREYQKVSYYDGKWTPEYEALIQAQIGWINHPDYPKVAWNAALTTEMILTQPVIYEFPLLHLPTLLIIGQRDRTAIGKTWVSKEVAAPLGNYPVLGRAAAQAIPHAKLAEIQGAGHVPQIEKFPEYKAALLNFMTQEGKI